MDKDTNKLFGCIGLAVTGFGATAIVMTVGAILEGWALSVLWEWFVVPLLGLPALPIVYAIGFSTIVVLLQNTHYDSEDRPDTKTLFLRLFWSTAGKPAFLLTVGYIVHLFV